MSVKCVILNEEQQIAVLGVASAFAKQSFQKDELINVENIIDTYYNALIEDGVVPLTALSLMQLTPSIMFQVISGNQELFMHISGIIILF